MLNQADLLQIFDHLPAPALILLPDEPYFTIAGSNKAYRSICSLTEHQTPGSKFAECSPSYLEEAGALRKVVAHKSVILVEAHEFKKPNGDTTYYDITYTPLFGSEHEVKYIVRSLRDVTAIYSSKQGEERVKQSLSDNVQLMAHVQEMARFGNWRWDIVQNKVTWSDTLYHIYGLDKDSFKATFEGYQELLHPDDKSVAYSSITHAVQTGKDVVFEERIIRPDGEVRHLRSWGRVQHDTMGSPARMIGACLDITESKVAQAKLQEHIDNIELKNTQLQEIAWIQSHVLRAPLVRIMGLVELMKQYSAEEISLPQTFDQILAAATELDNIIKDISARTEQLIHTGIALAKPKP